MMVEKSSVHTSRKTPDGDAPVVVVAPDKYRGSLTASEAAEALTLGVRAALPRAQVLARPMSDGGEGTIDALRAAGALTEERRVTGPLGQPVTAEWARLDGVHYVESAQACGISLTDETVPGRALHATSAGVGELLLAAAAGAPRRIVVGLGGTASTDGGFGIACALGWEALDKRGRRLPARAASLDEVWEIVPPSEPPLGDTEVVAATDVDNPLLGSRGAAAVFAPQKGASPADVSVLERRLDRWSEAVLRGTGRDVSAVAGGGAAGGSAAGLVGLLGARIESGAQLVIDLLGLPEAIRQADLVITGEGSLDAQTLGGKGPVAIARLARAAATDVIAVAGIADTDDPRMNEFFVVIGQLSAEARGNEDSFTDAALLARRLVHRLTAEWAAGRGA
jgi:glycerate kinase